jgi:hypothetical protein
MSKTKNKYSVSAVYKKSKKTDKLILVGYLSSKDEENGLDIKLDMAGYIISAV